MTSPLDKFRSDENLEYVAHTVGIPILAAKVKIPTFLSNNTKFYDSVYLREVSHKGIWKAVREMNAEFIDYLRQPEEYDEYEDCNIHHLLAGSELAKSLNVYEDRSIRMKTDPNMRLERREKIPPWQITKIGRGVDQLPFNNSMMSLEGRQIGPSIYSKQKHSSP